MQDYIGYVRAAVSRQLRMPVESVHADHVLERDLGVDTIDLAFIIVYLEDMSGLENMMLPVLEIDATVKDLAVALKPFLDRRPVRSRGGLSATPPRPSVPAARVDEGSKRRMAPQRIASTSR
jgi:acyl carrier protein